MATKSRVLSHLLFIIPALLVYTLFLVYPVAGTFHLSLFKWDGLKPVMEFVGLQNFSKTLADARFAPALFNTFFITVTVAVLMNVLALVAALLLDSKLKLTELFKTLLFLPVLVSGIAAGIIFMGLLDPRLGVVNIVLQRIGLGALALNWFGTPILTLVTISLIMVWMGQGILMIIYLAGLKSIPGELYEAAHIDGASNWTKFWKVTFPMLAPAVTINFSQVFISMLKIFDLPWLIFRGNPPVHGEVISTWLIGKAFFARRYGFSSAIAVILFLIIATLGFLQIFLLRKRELDLT